MRIIAAAAITITGFASVTILATKLRDEANGLIFGILLITLLLSLALIGGDKPKHETRNSH